MILNSILGLLLGGLFSTAFYLLGSSFKVLEESAENPLLGIIYFALGQGLFGYWLITIGNFGYFFPAAILSFILVVFLFHSKQLSQFYSWMRSLGGIFLPAQDKSLWIYQILFFISILISLIMCFLPEMTHDALCYQLAIPKLFVRYHSTVPIYYDFNSYMPFMMNILYASGLALKSVFLAKFFHWSCGVLLTAAVFYVIQNSFKNWKLSYLFSLLFWLTPTIFKESTMTYVDVGLGFFVFISLYLLILALNDRKPGLYLISGILYGLGLSVKYVALNSALGFAALFIFALLNQKKGRRFVLKGFFLFALGSFVSGGYWFIRNIILTGNPIFPHYGKLFHAETFSLFYGDVTMGLPKTILNFILVPWNIVFRPDFFDRAFWTGPFYLIAIPLAIVGSIKSRAARPYLYFGLLGTFCWYFMGQNVRYLIPALPAYTVAAAGGFNELKISKVFKRTFVTGFIAIACFTFAVNLYHFRYHYLVLSGTWDLNAYFYKMERTYPVSEWINSNLPQNAKVMISGEVKRYYIDRDTIRESFIRHRSEIDQLTKPQDAISFLKEIGVTHILFARPETTTLEQAFSERPPGVSRTLQNSKFSNLLITMTSENIRDEKYIYLVYELKNL